MQHTSSLNTHVETARIELIHFLFPQDASGSEERGHGVVDGLLYICKREPGPVRFESIIGRTGLQFFFNGDEDKPAGDAVGIEDDQVFPRFVLRHSYGFVRRPEFGLLVIVYVHLSWICVHYLLAGKWRTIFHNYDFKALFETLFGQTLQQFVTSSGRLYTGIMTEYLIGINLFSSFFPFKCWAGVLLKNLFKADLIHIQRYRWAGWHVSSAYRATMLFLLYKLAILIVGFVLWQFHLMIDGSAHRITYQYSISLLF